MAKSFIKIKPVKAVSEGHNLREIKPKYLIKNSSENLSFQTSTILEKRQYLEKLVKEKTGRKMQKKATPIREAVVILPDDNNQLNFLALEDLSKKLEENYGIKTFQCHIHNDEGHLDENGKAKYNFHAHLLFDWTNHLTGRSLKLNKEDMSDIQTLTAEILSMKRGVKGSKNLSLNHHQYRGYLEISDKLKKKFKRELKEEEKIKIRTEIKSKAIESKAIESKKTTEKKGFKI